MLRRTRLHRHGQMGVRTSSRCLDSPPNRADGVCAPVATTAASLKLIRAMMLHYGSDGGAAPETTCSEQSQAIAELSRGRDTAAQL